LRAFGRLHEKEKARKLGAISFAFVMNPGAMFHAASFETCLPGKPFWNPRSFILRQVPWLRPIILVLFAEIADHFSRFNVKPFADVGNPVLLVQ
jgi:hypothetical protein